MIAKVTGSGERIAYYEISDREMATGSTLGSPTSTLRIKATGAIERFYSVAAGTIVAGTLVLHHWDEITGIALPALPGSFIIHPDHQEHIFELTNGVYVEEDIFVLSGQPQGDRVDPPAAYYKVTLTNQSGDDLRVGTYASLQLRGDTGHDVVSTYNTRSNAIVAWNKSDPSLARAFACSVEPASYEVTTDSAKASAVHFPGPLSNRTLRVATEPIAIFHLRHHLRDGESASFWLTLSFDLGGRAAAQRTLRRCPPADEALARTNAYYDEILNRSVVMTPDQDVNRGVLWAKANMLRVQNLAPTGWCFVNDPTRSNNSVARDTSWFAFGSDYITPDFSRESLLWYATHLERSGMVVEYYDIRTGKTADYHLNINDNTPLLIMALWHHYNTSGDRDFLKKIYKAARRAAAYILTQRDERGLVWCTATGTADWGIVGWRNVIENYRLSGATTEVNSECYSALLTVSHMARLLGKHEDSGWFKGEAEALRAAINEHLLDPRTGLYYLNIDLDGTPRTDVTSDLVFPVMFGVPDDDTAAHIISRLSVPEFWSDAGLHTVPRNDVNYGPTHGYGLLGGVWVAVTFWYAFAAARFNSEFMAYSLGSSFRHYSSDPRRNNTVPGQFSEWLHGETLTNQGMMLSPWFPPRYLWAAIEGAAGLDVSSSEPRIHPRLAPDWKWLGVRRLPFRGSYLTWFVVRLPELQLYTNSHIESELPSEVYDADVTQWVEVTGDSAVVIALRRKERLLIFIGNTLDRTTSTALRLEYDLKGKYAMRTYNSLRGAWVEGELVAPKILQRGLPVQLDRRGFCLIELRQDV